MKILKQQEIFEKKETRYQSGLQNFVGKTGRTVSANEIEIQYVIIISRPLLTYLLTGTDRLERAVEGIRTSVRIQFGIKINKL